MHARLTALGCALVIALAACGDDTSEGTTDPEAATPASGEPSNQGPNPTSEDPGPNDTSDGPETVQGVLVLDTEAACVAIDLGAEVIAPTFVDYSYGELGDGAALVDDDGVPIARAGDAIIVAGYRAAPGGTPGPCGSVFEVESLVNVTPSR